MTKMVAGGVTVYFLKDIFTGKTIAARRINTPNLGKRNKGYAPLARAPKKFLLDFFKKI